jgi:type I restriction enzyme, R subunit
LVFAKPVRSWIKFHQMIGRGTRVLDDNLSARKPWCKEKNKFLIIDCWENFEHFEEDPKASTDKASIALPVRLFNARLKRLEASLDARDQATAAKMRDQLKEQVNALPENSVVVRDHASTLHKVSTDIFWEGLV